MNRILKSFKNNGDECTLNECDYFQLELLGNNAVQNNSVALISKKCLERVLGFKWYLDKNGYAIGYGSDGLKMKCGRGVKLHRVLCSLFIGKIESGEVVDHINRDKLDNRLDNLRICNKKQNSYNTSKRNNKYKGVSKTGDGWSAKITKDGQNYVIKNISSEKAAAKIYDYMAEELFGQYAGKNYL